MKKGKSINFINIKDFFLKVYSLKKHKQYNRKKFNDFVSNQ